MNVVDWSGARFAVVPLSLEQVSLENEFPESGWGALLCFLGGPTRVACVPGTRIDKDFVRETRVVAAQESVRDIARTAEDQLLIDTMIDTYLDEAGVNARPRGYRWFLTPATVADGVTVGEMSDGVTVGEMSRMLQRALERSGSDGTPSEVLRIGRDLFGNAVGEG